MSEFSYYWKSKDGKYEIGLRGGEWVTKRYGEPSGLGRQLLGHKWLVSLLDDLEQAEMRIALLEQEKSELMASAVEAGPKTEGISIASLSIHKGWTTVWPEARLADRSIWRDQWEPVEECCVDLESSPEEWVDDMNLAATHINYRLVDRVTGEVVAGFMGAE